MPKTVCLWTLLVGLSLCGCGDTVAPDDDPLTLDALVGPTWTLVTIVHGGAEVTIPEGAQPTLTVQADEL